MLIALLFLGGTIGGAEEPSPTLVSANPITVALKPAPGPLNNPMKGWCQYPNLKTHSQAASMTFHYASWKMLEPREGEYAFDQWETKEWNEPEHADKHVVLRVFIDYPKKDSGLPEWLIEKGVSQKPYDDHGGGLSPNYEHPAMLASMKRFIAAFGKRYNENPRVAFIQLGMLGHWGEWHTYPRNELFASLPTQREVIDAFHHAFPDKQLMTRTADHYAGTLPWIGYHDDLFPDDTDNGHGWSFLAKIRAAKRDQNWRVAPIGGEMVPGEAKKWLVDEFATTMEMVERSHFSWVGPYGPAHEPEPTDQYLKNCESMLRRLGYEFRLTHVRHPHEIRVDEVNEGIPIRIDLRGENQGVAPFYYRWPVQFALLDSAKDSTPNSVVCVGDTNWDIRRWQPGSAFIENESLRFEMVHANREIKPGQYRLAIGVIDPWKTSPRIEFANELQVVDGWTVLSEIRLTD